MSSTQLTIANRLTQPVDGLWLALYRIGLGACLLWQMWKYFSTDLIYSDFIEPTHHFTWLWFDFVKPWPGQGMYIHFYVLAVAASCILVGFHYRLAAFVFWLGYTWVFLIDQCYYLNHYYLICLLSFLAMFLPANREWSIDALRNPELRRDWAPTWTLWLLRYQIAIPYVFGGIAKINSDWLHGEPIRTWLAERTDFPVIGQYFTAEWCVQTFVYGGFLLDLAVVPLLLWKRTRPVALLLAVSFHLLNSQLFIIGIFPWMMIWVTVVLFTSPDTIGLLRRRPSVLPGNGTISETARQRRHQWGAAILVMFLCWQTLTPLRHWCYPGHTAFTHEGHHFSWRMKLNIRSLRTQFTATNSVTQSQQPLPVYRWISYYQNRKLQDADQLLQLVQWMEHDLQQAGDPDPVITVDAWLTLNGRPSTRFIDSQLDLTQLQRTWQPTEWVMQQPVPLLLSDVALEDQHD
jgi:vitamin K-dependent gamma-carboxylase